MGTKKINLLIVDDEEQFLNAMTRRLQVRGFHVIAVDRGEKALEAAQTQPVDIALVDLKMPGIDGEKTLKALKAKHPWMEVIILTGHGSIDSAVECIKTGAYAYLQKPCEFEHLLDMLIAAYKRKVINKTQMDEKKMEEFLRPALSESPTAILQKIRELDSESDRQDADA